MNVLGVTGEGAHNSSNRFCDLLLSLHLRRANS